MQKIASKLDWTRMLGFEQIADVRTVVGNAKLMSKVGDKVGNKVGSKAGVKA